MIKEIFTRAIGYLVSGIGFILLIFFKNYTGVLIPYTSLWAALGIVLIVTGILIQVRSYRYYWKRKQKFAIEHLQNHKENSVRVKIPVGDCRVFEKNNSIVLSCTYRYNGRNKEYKMSLEVFQDLLSADVFLSQKENIYLYIDKRNEEKYLFDFD